MQQRANIDPDEHRRFEEVHWMLNSDNLTVLYLALAANNFVESQILKPYTNLDGTDRAVSQALAGSVALYFTLVKFGMRIPQLKLLVMLCALIAVLW